MFWVHTAVLMASCEHQKSNSINTTWILCETVISGGNIVHRAGCTAEKRRRSPHYKCRCCFHVFGVRRVPAWTNLSLKQTEAFMPLTESLNAPTGSFQASLPTSSHFSHRVKPQKPSERFSSETSSRLIAVAVNRKWCLQQQRSSWCSCWNSPTAASLITVMFLRASLCRIQLLLISSDHFHYWLTCLFFRLID